MKSIIARLSPRFSQSDTSMPKPTRCPYCPQNSACHWKKHASYKRKDPRRPADRPDDVFVPRYFCKIVRRTFSLLPDGLLPYQQRTTETILRWLHCMIIEGHGTAKAARIMAESPTTLRRVRSRYHAAVKVLRLPGHEGAFDPASFLRRLLAMSVSSIVDLFVDWKQLEPKLSLVGSYPR